METSSGIQTHGSGRLAPVKPTIRSCDLAHLAHVELLSPKPDESLRFFTDVLGMTESGRRGDSVYLRAWDDYEHHTLKLTAARVAGMGHVAFRAPSPEGVEHRAAAIEAAGFGTGWTDGDLGHGRTYAFNTTDGHAMEIYYETEWYAPPAALKPALKNQAQRFPARGANVRRLDHLNLLAADVRALRQFFEDVLGMRTTEMIVLDNGDEAGAWVTATNKSYDLAFTADHYGARGRCHPLTYAGRRHLSGERRVHRDRTAQARDSADLLSLRLRTGRQPRRGRQRRRAPRPRTRLAADRVDRSGAEERSGLGTEDDRELPHVRHA